MVAFVRVSAVLIGSANALLLMMIGLWLAATGAEEFEGLNVYHVLLGLCIATVAGLFAAEVVLRLGRRALRGRFFSRYVVMVFGVCVGGASAVLIPALFLAVPLGTAGSLGAFFAAAVVFTVYGGLVGLAEGLVLAFPLAAILGTFGDETVAQARPQP